MRWSRRLEWNRATNAITRAVRERRERELPLVDLTVSNPTAVGFDTPRELAAALGDGAIAVYRPDPRGLIGAREALAEWLRARGAEGSDPHELFLTSSTSEAYSWILKVLCDPGDRVVRFTPTYPLLDHLCALEAVRLASFPMERTGMGWSPPESGQLAAALAGARGAIVVHPNNPTGTVFESNPIRDLSGQFVATGGALIADEVFYDFSLETLRRVASDADCLTFSLGGLSKSVGLPHWKLGWIRVTGPEEEKERAMKALELVADAYLSMSTPVQEALPAVLAHTDRVREAIMERIRRNLATIDEAISDLPAVRRDLFAGGWSAVLRVPLFEGEERLTVDLIEEGVLVHPGYFYDFPVEGWIVVSLLPREEEMERGMERIVRYFEERC